MRLIGSVVGHESGSSSFAMESRAQRRAAQRSAILFAGIVAAMIPASDKSWTRAKAGGRSTCAARQSLLEVETAGMSRSTMAQRGLVHDEWWKVRGAFFEKREAEVCARGWGEAD